MKKEEKNLYDNKKLNTFLKRKRGKEYSTEDIIYIYCLKNKIKEDEINVKIKNFEYKDPSTGETIIYDKDKKEKIPLHKEKLHKYFKTKKKEKINNTNKNEKKIKRCNFCNMVFPEMSEEEKIKHLNKCFDSF